MSEIQQYESHVEDLRKEKIDYTQRLQRWKARKYPPKLIKSLEENTLLIDEEIRVTRSLIKTLKKLEYERRMKRAVNAGEPDYSFAYFLRTLWPEPVTREKKNN